MTLGIDSVAKEDVKQQAFALYIKCGKDAGFEESMLIDIWNKADFDSSQADAEERTALLDNALTAYALAYEDTANASTNNPIHT